MITGQQLKCICTSLSLDRANVLATLLNEVCPLYDINTPKRLAAFLSQVAVESREFKRKVENLNYTTPARLAEVWKHRFTVTGEANEFNANDYVGQPEKIANAAYANREGNGDTASGDGWKHRGRGYIMITFKDMYRLYAKYKGMTIDEVIKLLETDDRYALDSACWIFSKVKCLNDEADLGTNAALIKIRERINGGRVELAESLNYYKVAIKILSI